MGHDIWPSAYQCMIAYRMVLTRANTTLCPVSRRRSSQVVTDLNFELRASTTVTEALWLLLWLVCSVTVAGLSDYTVTHDIQFESSTLSS